MRSLHLIRNFKQVWDGCEFCNGEVVGTWITNTPSYGYCRNFEELSKASESQDEVLTVSENLCSNGGSFVWLVTKNFKNLAIPDCPWIAEGMRFRNGWVCLIHMIKESAIYWYPNLSTLEALYGERSHIVLDSSNIGYPKFDADNPVWQREKIYL